MKQTVDLEEALNLVQESDEIKISAQEGNEILGLEIRSKTRESIIIRLNETELQLQEGVENFDELIVKLNIFLSDIGRQRSEVQRGTSEQISRETHLSRVLEFVPESMQPIIINIAKFGASIALLLHGESPFIKKGINKIMIDSLMMIQIRKRILSELRTLKENYRATQETSPNEKLNTVIDLLEKIINSLNFLIQSSTNALKSDERIHSIIFPSEK